MGPPRLAGFRSAWQQSRADARPLRARAGQANGRHLHPNCDEVLEVLEGSIVHSLAEQEFAMERGDVITIPAGIVHNARNVGQGGANLLICFSSAWRETVPVE